jgi:F0F1-type ATP synthase epsilon subunit
MELRIITPQKTQAHTIVWLDIETPIGSFIIQAGHAPMIVTLSEKVPLVYRLKNGKQETLMVLHGVVEVTRDVVTILMNSEL